jgi:hypothetical protein
MAFAGKTLFNATQQFALRGCWPSLAVTDWSMVYTDWSTCLHNRLTA